MWNVPGCYVVLPSFWIHGTRKQLQLQLYLLREALSERGLPEVFRPVLFIGWYHQTMVGMVHQGTWRIKNQPCGHSSMYIHCIWKDKEQKMEWSSPSCIFSAKIPGYRGLFPAAPLMVECKVYPSSGSSSLTQACSGGKKWRQGINVEQVLSCLLKTTELVWK